MKLKFWLRWAGRDLRQRWLQVIAIAMIIALGTGIYSGFGGQETFRVNSLDESYGALNMYDLRLSTQAGSSLPQEEALRVLSEVAGVGEVEPRLLLDTLVDATGSEGEFLVPGLIMGVNTKEGGPHVNKVHVETGGRELTAQDDRQAVLELNFARHYKLEPGERLALSGGLEVDVVGLGQIPEYFIVITPAGLPLGQANYGVVVLPLETVQQHYQLIGQVNDILISLAEGAQRESVQASIEEALAAAFPQEGVIIKITEDDPVYNMHYSDAKEDQVMLEFLGIVFLAGAAVAAFNLAGRIVESQRRQIGISMALGAPRSLIALRPLLIGLQIAAIGVVFGLLLGYGFTWLFGVTMFDLMPLPYWSEALIHWPSFIKAGLLGIFLPVAATLIPVWLAVRTPPLEAIHGHLATRSSGLNRWLRGVRLPGNTFTQMPAKNALRSVRRSGLMILGLATATILMTLFMGLLDTLINTIGQTEKAMLYQGEDRLIVNLTTLFPEDHPQVENLAGLTTAGGAPLFAEAEKGLILRGLLRTEDAPSGEATLTMLEYFNPGSRIWAPKLIAGSLDRSIDKPHVIVSQKMVDDWGLEVGDTVILEHPLREGLAGISMVESRVVIGGIHDNPLRNLSYVDASQPGFTGLEMATNSLMVVPAEDVRPETAQRILFAQPGVASAQTITSVVSIFGDAVGVFVSVLGVVQGMVVLMAFLIAYNATSINLDDRIREIATMFAFGLRPRTVLWVQVGENLMLGLFGAAIGLALGYPMLEHMMAARMETQLENIGLIIVASPGTLAMVFLFTAGVVALTPIVNFRRLLKINIPNTLRVME